MKKTAVVVWHDSLVVGPYSFLSLHNKLHMLASPHSDGAVIASVLRKFGFNIIEGSTNKNSMAAAKNIMKALDCNENIVLTPDGPRGPRHKINSNIIEIAARTGASIMPVAYKPTNYFKIHSWDILIVPLPFGKVKIFCGTPVAVNKNSKLSAEKLEQILNSLGI